MTHTIFTIKTVGKDSVEVIGDVFACQYFRELKQSDPKGSYTLTRLTGNGGDEVLMSHNSINQSINKNCNSTY